MPTTGKKLILFLASALYLIMISTPLYADDTEIFTGKAVGSTSAKPNVLFIVDTSGSMSTKDVNVPNGLYDPSKTYPGSCDSSRYYWSNDTSLPDCSASSSSNRYIIASLFKCDDAASALGTSGSGYYVGRLARYLASVSGDYWTKLATNTNEYVECAADYGVHGDGVNTSNLYPADQNNGGPWKANNTNALDWNTTGGSYTIYTANYINYLNTSGPIVKLRRLTVVTHALKNLIDSTSGINAALMRYDANWGQWIYTSSGWSVTGSKGGSFVQPMQTIDSSTRTGFKDSIDNLTAGGATPLAETLYEAMLYYRGEHVHFGNNTTPPNVSSVLDPNDASLYKSPIKFQCSKNFTVLLTDGDPVYDSDADTLINGGNKGAPNNDTFPGLAPSGTTICSYSASPTNDCLDELAGYMYNNDQSSLPDKQNIITYTIGFSPNNGISSSGQTLLVNTAKNGGGKYFEATSANDLAKAFTSILTDIGKVSTTFVSPAVSVNAFNRLTHRNDLYFALFRPTINYRWPGNLKKYQLVRAVAGDPSSNLIIADVNGNNAVDPSTGLFTSTAQSYWSGSVDGADVEKGGAAEMLPTPANRKIYTFTGADSALLAPQTAAITLESLKNKLLDSNTALTKSMLGLSNTASSADRTSLIQWTRGVDVLDENNNGSTTDARQAIGDPLHSEPQLVTYKGTTEANADITLYMTTNQGFLHAMDAKTGVEQFAFIPKDLLSHLPLLEGNTTTTSRLYGLDGPMTVWHNDLNNDLLVLNTDGTVQTGEHVYLYFGMRRGGRNYYALDVTDRSSPKLKWEIKGGTGDFAELGQTWSKMIHAKIKFNGADRDVLIFGGGYDSSMDSSTLPSADNMGRALYMVDANTGKRLWWASIASSNADLKLADMKNALAANVTAFDSTGDGYVDQIYAADTAARIWRFDINKSNTGAANLMTGGVIADLNGTATNVSNSEAAANNRHFFSAPDVAYVRQGSQEYLTIAIGSGFRAHPLETTTQDRFYVIRDTDVRGPAKDANGNAIYTTITENDLYDATKNLAGEGTQTQIDAARQALNTDNGWYIKLNKDDKAGTFVGEKVLGKSVTFNNILIFASFTPTPPDSQSDSCAPGKGTSSAWAINLLDAQPVFNFCNNGSLKRCDRKGVLNITGLPPSPRILFPKDGGEATTFFGTVQMKAKILPSNYYKMDYWNIK